MIKRKLKILIFSFFLLIITLAPNIFLIKIEKLYAAEAKDSILIEKISKDFTKKFCNSVGFGLSKESAMNFSLSENKQIFKNRKGIENVDKELLAQKIADSVIYSCGYQLDLLEGKDVEEFSNYYMSLDKETSLLKKESDNSKVENNE